MGQASGRLRIERGNLLPESPVAEAVEYRATQVQYLLLKRRKIALTYKRTQDESDRIALEHIDSELTAYRIDIPAVQRSASSSQRPTARGRRPEVVD
jgi:hypothetical protein